MFQPRTIARCLSRQAAGAACALILLSQSGASEEKFDDGFPDVPEKQFPSLTAIPKDGQFVVEVGIPYGRGAPSAKARSEIRIFDLRSRQTFQWDLPRDVLEGQPRHGGQSSWIPATSELFFSRIGATFIISRDGEARRLDLQLPGQLPEFLAVKNYAVSPDGQFVAFFLDSGIAGDPKFYGLERPYVDLMIEKITGSVPVTIERDAQISALTWSPDGRKIAYATLHGQIVILDVSGKKLIDTGPVGSGETQLRMIDKLRWSPDGQRLGILADREIYVMDENGVQKRIELKSRGLFSETRFDIRSFAWSPDGKKLVFRSTYQAPETCNHVGGWAYKFETGSYPCVYGFNLFVSNADGTGLSRITAKPDYMYLYSGELFWVQ